jgi:hypothetical protein
MRKFEIVIGTWIIPKVKRDKLKYECDKEYRKVTVNIKNKDIDSFGSDPENYVPGFDMENDSVSEIHENGMRLY